MCGSACRCGPTGLANTAGDEDGAVSSAPQATKERSSIATASGARDDHSAEPTASGTASTRVWHLRGEWFDVCSCGLPCPCTFAQAPTHGDCLFTLVWHVHEGHFGETDLSGLGVLAVGEFTGNMWVGDPGAMMTLMFYLDAEADADQRYALERIFTGREGGWPGQFGALIGELRGIEYAPVRFQAATDLAYWEAEIPNKVKVGAQALTGPTADPNRRVQLINAPGAEVGPGQVATWGVVRDDHATGFDFSRPYHGGSSKHFPFDWRP